MTGSLRSRSKVIGLIAIVVISAFAIGLLARDQVEHRVDLHSVLAIWGDLLRDVEHVPLTVTRMSVADEKALGDKIHQAMFGRLETANRLHQRYVEAVGESLAAHVQRTAMRYRFHVISTPEVNAFALLGGHVYVTTGLLDFVDTEAELAAVIGHELSHVDLHHSVQKFQYEYIAGKVVGEDLAQLARIGRRLFEVGFSEQQEVEADAVGMVMMAAADYDPGAAVDVQRRFAERQPAARGKVAERPGTMTGELGRAVAGALGEYFATHPGGARRVSEIQAVYRKNAAGWRHFRFYAGRSNLQDRVAKSDEERDQEWGGFREPEDLVIAASMLAAAPVKDDERPRPAERPAPASEDEERKPSEERRPPTAPASGARVALLSWNKSLLSTKIRKRPDFQANSLGRVEANEDVYVIAQMAGGYWAQIAVPGRNIDDGYLYYSDLADPTGFPDIDSTLLETTPLQQHRVERWNEVALAGTLRAQPQRTATAQAEVGKGDNVFVLARFTASPWVRVRVVRQSGSALVGYLPAWMLMNPILETTGFFAGTPILAWNRSAGRADIRTRPDFNGKKLGRLQVNEDIFVVARLAKGYWIQIAVPGRNIDEAYLEHWQLDEPLRLAGDDSTRLERTPREQQVERWNEVALSSVLRVRPERAAPVQAQVSKGDKVFVLARLMATHWLKVRAFTREHGVQVGHLPAWTLKDPVLQATDADAATPATGQRTTPVDAVAGEIPINRWNQMAWTENVRLAPDWGAKVVGVAVRGDDVYVFSRVSPLCSWVRVRVAKDRGYLHGYLDATFLLESIKALEVPGEVAPRSPLR